MADKITKSIIVKGEVKDVFSLWANCENFPFFMKNIKSVRKTGENTSHWIMGSRIGKDLEWDAKITDFQEDKRIGWSSFSGDIKTSGQVTFTPLDHVETEVTVQVQYIPPVGEIGRMLAHLFENPDERVKEDLKQFKKFAERQYQKA